MPRKNKSDSYREKECMQNFSSDLRKHAVKINSYEKKEMIPLTNEEIKSYRKHNVCHICKKEFSSDVNYKKY